MRTWLTCLIILILRTSDFAQEPQEKGQVSEAARAARTALCVHAIDDPSAAQLEALKQFAALRMEAEVLEQNAARALEVAPVEDRARIRNDQLNQMMPIRAHYAAKALELAKGCDPKDPATFEPLLFALQNGFLGRKPAEVAQARELLLKHQLDHPQFGTVISFIASLGPDQMAVIETISREAKSSSTKGQAFYTLGFMNLQYSSAVASVDAKAAADRLKAAKDYFELVVSRYPEAQTPRGQVGLLAKGLLTEMTVLQVGNAAPEVICLNLEAAKQDKLSDYKGKVVVLEIWATWSRQSLAAIAEHRGMVEKLKNKPFALISVSGDAKRETLEKFLEKTKMPWIHWFAGQSGIILDWGVRKYPTTYILDHKGVIRAKDLRGKQLEAKVMELLAQVEPGPQG